MPKIPDSARSTRGKVVKPSLRKEMAHKVVKQKGISIRLACHIFGISQTCYRYQPKLANENAIIANWLLRLTAAHKGWGFGLCFDYLRNVKNLTGTINGSIAFTEI